MRRVILLLLLFIIAGQAIAQRPKPFVFQIVARDRGGEILANQNISIRLSIIETNLQGETVFTEEHNLITPSSGKVTLTLGAGRARSALWEVDWKQKTDYFLKAEIAPEGQGNYYTAQTVQLVFLPGGIYSGTVEDFADPRDAPDDKLEPTSIDGNVIHLSNGGWVRIPEYFFNFSALRVQTNVQDVSCHGLENGRIQTKIDGGTPPYNFEWSDGANTQNRDSLAAGNYTLYLTDSKGFTAVRRIKVTQPDPLKLNLDVVNVSDVGKKDGEIHVNIEGGKPPYEFLWSNDSSKQHLTNLSPGKYKLRVISAGSCIKDTTVNVKVPLVTEYRVKHLSCYQSNDGEIKLNIKGGVPPYGVYWSTQSSKTHLTDLKAGAYVAAISDNMGTRRLDTIVIRQPPPIQIQASVKHVGQSSEPIGAIALNVKGGRPPYRYIWSNSDTTKNIYNISDGVYHVRVKDANTCVKEKNNIFVYRTMTDKRDSQDYKVITINDQTWMAENLRYGKKLAQVEEPAKNKVIEKYCYKGKDENCELLGGLYSWDEMMQYNNSDNRSTGNTQGVCPEGWHIPTDKEWARLTDYLGGELVAGSRMKNQVYWPGNVNQQLTQSGFSALPAGSMDMTGQYYYAGSLASFWSATKESSKQAWQRTITYRGAGLYRTKSHISYRLSVRCIKDEASAIRSIFFDGD